MVNLGFSHSRHLIEGSRFETTSTQGAILVLPDGGSRSDALNKRKFRELITHNAVSWYQFANETLGRDIQNGSLYLITGRDASPSYGVASFSDNSGTESVAASFLATEGEDDHRRRVYSWRTHHSISHRTGIGENGLMNQCVFLRGFRIAVNERLLGQGSDELISDVQFSQITEPPSPEFQQYQRSIPFGDSRLTGASSNNPSPGSSGGHSRQLTDSPPIQVDMQPLPGSSQVSYS
jgi:hypothetical protein